MLSIVREFLTLSRVTIYRIDTMHAHFVGAMHGALWVDAVFMHPIGESVIVG